MFPSDKDFIENKKISDRLYMWCLLNGTYKDNGIYIKKNDNRGAKSLNIDRRTFKKRIAALIEGGYLKNCEDDNYYMIPKAEIQYKRYIYRDVAEKLYKAETDNLIKLFIVLSTYHDKYKGSVVITVKDMLNGYELSEAVPYNHDIVQNHKMENMLTKLVELGLLKYGRSPRYNESNPGSKQYVVERIG